MRFVSVPSNPLPPPASAGCRLRLSIGRAASKLTTVSARLASARQYPPRQQRMRARLSQRRAIFIGRSKLRPSRRKRRRCGKATLALLQGRGRPCHISSRPRMQGGHTTARTKAMRIRANASRRFQTGMGGAEEADGAAVPSIFFNPRSASGSFDLSTSRYAAKPRSATTGMNRQTRHIGRVALLRHRREGRAPARPNPPLR